MRLRRQVGALLQRVRQVDRGVRVVGGGGQDGSVAVDGAADQRLRIVRLDIASDAIPEEARSSAAAALANVTIDFTQDARGAITARHMVGTVPEALRPILDNVVESLDQMGAILPAAPVAVGAAWHDQRTFHVMPGGALDMLIDVTYTL